MDDCSEQTPGRVFYLGELCIFVCQNLVYPRLRHLRQRKHSPDGAQETKSLDVSPSLVAMQVGYRPTDVELDCCWMTASLCIFSWEVVQLE